jgi:parallel beta-helix repeat protein
MITTRVLLSVVLLTFLAACQTVSPTLEASATSLYVATTGSDNNPGTSAQPLRTIQAAADKVQAGQTVIVKGGVYYERVINIRRGGTTTAPVTFRAAPGERVVIDHGLRVQSWQSDTGSVFKAKIIPFPDMTASEFKYDDTIAVVVGDKPLKRVQSRSSLVAGSYWVESSSGLLYVWAPDGSSPQGKETVIVNWSKSGPGIFIWNDGNYSGGKAGPVANIVFDGFIHRGAEAAIWASNFDVRSGAVNENLTIKNCQIAHNYQYALRLDGWKGAVLQNCNIYNNGLVNWPRGSNGWPHAIISWQTQSVRILGNQIHDNHGEGVGPFSDSSNWIIADNKVFDNWSVNIYIDSSADNHIVRNNLVYNTGKYGMTGNNNPDGIRIANEDADCQTGNEDPTPAISNVRVTNNIIINTGGGIRQFNYNDPSYCNRGGRSYLKDSLIANNTVVRSTSNNGVGDGIVVGTGADNVQMVNNIIVEDELAIYGAQGAGVKVQNNVLSAVSSLNASGAGISVSGMIYGNPGFVSGTGYVAQNYKLQATSPGVNKGLSLSQVLFDYERVKRPQGGVYDIGAFER